MSYPIADRLIANFAAFFSGEHPSSPVSRLDQANAMRSQIDGVAKATRLLHTVPSQRSRKHKMARLLAVSAVCETGVEFDP